MKTTAIIYVIAWLLPITLVILFLTGSIQQVATISNPMLTYLLSITSVVLSLLTAWLAMKMFNIPVIKKRLQMLSGKHKEQSYQMLCRLRIIFVLMVILIDFATFYVLGNSSPLYLAAIMGVALIFCWPQRQMIGNVEDKEDKREQR